MVEKLKNTIVVFRGRQDDFSGRRAVRAVKGRNNYGAAADNAERGPTNRSDAARYYCGSHFVRHNGGKSAPVNSCQWRYYTARPVTNNIATRSRCCRASARCDVIVTPAANEPLPHCYLIEFPDNHVISIGARARARARTTLKTRPFRPIPRAAGRGSIIHRYGINERRHPDGRYGVSCTPRTKRDCVFAARARARTTDVGAYQRPILAFTSE